MTKKHRHWLELLLQPHRNMGEMDNRFVDGLMIRKPDKLTDMEERKLIILYDKYITPYGTEL